jgi:2',3'-cyclic-nucleotide 2'-phosphodiesterase (5'-nucleotidase family)
MKRGLTYLTALVILSLGLTAHASRTATQDRITVASELSTKNARKEESGLANVIADAIRDAANCDAAFVSASSFSEQTVPKGSATVEDFLKALAFRNDSVVVVKLTGEKVRAALEHGLALYPQMHSAFLQVSGMSVSIDPKQEKDRRVTAVRIGGGALDDKKVYTVAMPSPLADGGLAYYRIWSKSDIDKGKDPKLSLEDAVRKYLRGKASVGDSGDRLDFKK